MQVTNRATLMPLSIADCRLPIVCKSTDIMGRLTVIQHWGRLTQQIGNWKSAMSEGDHSLDVSRRVDVFAQRILHGLESVVTVGDKRRDIDAAGFDEIQC